MGAVRVESTGETSTPSILCRGWLGGGVAGGLESEGGLEEQDFCYWSLNWEWAKGPNPRQWEDILLLGAFGIWSLMRFRRCRRTLNVHDEDLSLCVWVRLMLLRSGVINVMKRLGGK